MKLKIKVKANNESFVPCACSKGDWVDLKAAEDIRLHNAQAGARYQSEGKKYRDVYFNSTLVSLGIAMQLPEGYEAILAPRSSSFKKFGFIQSNSFGVVDNSYCGNNDIWKLPIIAINVVNIKKGDRIAQFRIQLSQKASIKQRLKWLFCNGIEFEQVDNLENEDRGGFGSTGV